MHSESKYVNYDHYHVTVSDESVSLGDYSGFNGSDDG